MPGLVPAPRVFDQAAARYLADYSDFPARFRWDAPARTWRRHADGRWTLARFEVVVADASDLLHTVLSGDPIPLVFRCVFAPASDVTTLEAVADWDADRALRQARVDADARATYEASEARKRTERAELLAAIDNGSAGPAAFRKLPALEPSHFRPPGEVRPLVLRPQRERLLRAVSRRGVESAVRLASGMPPLRYVAEAAPVEVDPRAWLGQLPRIPGVRVLSSALYAAYVEALPVGARPLHNRAFHALAVEVLGDGDEAACRRRIKGYAYYLDVAIAVPGDAPDLPTPLRLVAAEESA